MWRKITHGELDDIQAHVDMIQIFRRSGRFVRPQNDLDATGCEPP